MNGDVNANIAECIKRVTHLGYNSFHNICNGQVTNLAWGIGDWAMLSFIFGMAVFFLIAAAFLVFMVVREYVE